MPEMPRELREALRSVRSVGVITGAGISVESGIPSYRGKGGIYDDPEEGDRTVEALSVLTLHSDPQRTWKVMATLGRQAQAAEPNKGHHALVNIEATVERFTLLTQNVDGLHQRAGSTNIIDIHGGMDQLYCMKCALPAAAQDFKTVINSLKGIPRCECGGVLRPDVVLFGEMLSAKKLERMNEAFYQNTPDLVMVVGTSAMFPYIVEPVLFAHRRGKLTIEVNPQPVLANGVGFVLAGSAGAYLPQVAAALSGKPVEPNEMGN
jgi:NAD-dependent deacetylase